MLNNFYFFFSTKNFDRLKILIGCALPVIHKNHSEKLDNLTSWKVNCPLLFQQSVQPVPVDFHFLLLNTMMMLQLLTTWVEIEQQVLVLAILSG
jgi:hypothetical protein